jgi:hypothetical protein
MKSIRLVKASVAMLVVAACATALAGDDRHRDYSDRIVGLWSTEGLVGPCSGTPVVPIRNTLLFHAGGTVTENARFGPNGAPNVAGIPGLYQRSSGLGTWHFDVRKRKFFLHLQFDNYVDNIYHGFSTVDREITLSNGAMLASGSVVSRRYNAAGEILTEACGQATSTRL